MPKVGDKHFAYTPAGEAAASKYAAKSGKKVQKRYSTSMNAFVPVKSAKQKPIMTPKQGGPMTPQSGGSPGPVSPGIADGSASKGKFGPPVPRTGKVSSQPCTDCGSNTMKVQAPGVAAHSKGHDKRGPEGLAQKRKSQAGDAKLAKQMYRHGKAH